MKEDFTGYFGTGNGPGAGLVPRWSNVWQIGFPFLFNGQPVTAFKVSTTGVLTFDTAVTLVPPAMHATLPNLQIPDKSVCILGINSTCMSSNGSSMVIGTQTTDDRAHPLRQLWVTFNNYSDTIVTQMGRTLSWSIVLEEGTNNIYFIDQHDWFIPQLTLGIQVDTTTAYMMLGSPFIGAHSPVNWYMADNIYYTFEPVAPVNVDATIRKTNINNYLDINDAPYTFMAEFRNLATPVVHSFRINYSINGGSIYSESVNGVNIKCGETYWETFSSAISVPDTGEYFLDVWADLINGQADQYTTNDHLIQRLYVAPTLPRRRVMFEELKSTFCNYSGTWTHLYDSILDLNKAKASSIKYEEVMFAMSQEDLTPRRKILNEWAVPTAYANGQFLNAKASPLFPGCPHHATQNYIDSLYLLPGLFDITPHLTINGLNVSLSAGINSKVRFPQSARCNIIVALYEDTITSSPTMMSGETLFVNTSRKLFPDGNGTYVGVPQFGDYDTVSFNYNITSTSPNASRLHLVVFIQDTITREIFQCADVKGTISCQATYNITTHILCAGDSILINGNWESENGEYPSQHVGANGCDSLQIDKIDALGMFAVINPYNGQLWKNASGGYHMNDSISWEWYDASTQHLFPQPFVSPFTPPGPGIYAVKMTNHTTGCSVFSNFIHYCTPVNSPAQNYTICMGDTVTISDRKIYNNFNSIISLTQAGGCGDSIIPVQVTVINVNSTISYTPGVLMVPAVSVSYQWYECNGTILTGDTLNTLIVDTTQTGSYYCVVTGQAGCTKATSCYEINPAVILSNPQITHSSVNICPGDSFYFNGQMLVDSGGPYLDTILNSFGFDSVAIVTLTTRNPNTNVTSTMDALISDASGLGYQWMDCGAGNILIGVTDSAFYPQQSGIYAVIVADGYCTDTSSCIPFIWDHIRPVDKIDFVLYPNPAADYLKIECTEQVDGTLEICDVTGRKIYFKKFHGGNAVVDVSFLPAGSYLVRISGEEFQWSRVLIKE